MGARLLASVATMVGLGTIPLVTAPVAATAAGTLQPVATWTTDQPATNPPALTAASAAYDTDTGTVVLFGGLTQAGTLSSDTWVWNGQNWTDFPPSASTPPAREMASMAFDPVLHRLILFGGQASDGSLLGDTWAWNGNTWIQLTSSSPQSPTPREGAALAFDPAGDLVLFGGTGTATGPSPTTTTTTTIPSVTGGLNGGSPPTTSTSSNAVRAASASGDITLNDTWQWTSNGWVQSQAAAPPARSDASMTYDSTSGTTVLFGGESTPAGSTPASVLGETWVWDGAHWTAAQPSTSPPARDYAGFADAPIIGGALLFDGGGASSLLADAWEWNGTNWISATVTGSHAARDQTASATDGVTGQIVNFGGTASAGAILNNTDLIDPSLVPSSTSTSTSPPTNPSGKSNRTTTTRPGTKSVPNVPTSRPTSTQSPSTTLSRTTTGTSASGSHAVASSNRAGTLILESNAKDLHQGTAVQLTGRGFRPGTVVTLTFHSKPSYLGQVTANDLGDIAAEVSVPPNAPPGQHHIEAIGTAPDGRTTMLVAAVFVLGPLHAPSTLTTKLVMSGLALLLPVAAWFAMDALRWWRKRRVAPAAP